MKSGLNSQRYFFFQLYFIIQIICLAIILISIIALGFAFSLFRFFAIVITLIGIACYVINKQRSRRQRVLQGYYLVSSLMSLLSLIFTAQILAGFTIIGWFSNFIFFLILSLPIIGITIYIITTSNRYVLRAMKLPNLTVLIISCVILSIFIYRFIICSFFVSSFLLFLAYLFGVIGLILCIIIATDIRCLLYQGR